MGISGVYSDSARSARLSPRREVYPSAEIPHLWAHGIPDGKRVRNGTGNFYAIGDTIYSYGPHFPIARRVTLRANGANDRRGEVVYLLTTGKYSVTTSGHVSAVLASIPDKGGFTWKGSYKDGDQSPSASNIVAMPPKDSRGRDLWRALTDRKSSALPVVEWFRDRIDRTARAAVAPRIRATTRARLFARIGEIVEEWRAVHSMFGLRVKIDSVSAPADMDALRDQVARESERVARANARAVASAKRAAARLESERAERERVALAEVLPAWRAGRVDDSPSVKVRPMVAGQYVTIRDIPYPVLRIVSEDGANVVETSHGARVSVDDARKVLGMVPRLLERIGETDDSAEVGHYRRVGATREALRIGCHSIPWSEVRAFVDHYGERFGFGLPHLTGVAV